VVDCLPSKHKAMSSNFSTTSPQKKMGDKQVPLIFFCSPLLLYQKKEKAPTKIHNVKEKEISLYRMQNDSKFQHTVLSLFNHSFIY
jgi:hypothetical protein